MFTMIAQKSTGKLSIVATPIGNLGDITFRAVETLKASDYILAEDTRHSVKLIQHYEISKKLVAYHAHNEHEKTDSIIHDLLKNNKKISLITDAGTPSISDPGYLLINRCISESIAIEYLPGACAFLAALILSGFPTSPFLFLGFLPVKKGRQKALASLGENQTIILYESPHRLLKLVEELRMRFGNNKKIVIAKELTKIHESIYRGSLEDVLIQLTPETLKGEFVLIIQS